MRENGKLDYLEMRATDVGAAKQFYADAFGWTFQDYGPRYSAFSEGLDGGLDAAGATAPLPVIYADNLEDMLEHVVRAGGTITRQPFAFPGGRRFHFSDPSGNELAVWSEK